MVKEVKLYSVTADSGEVFQEKWDCSVEELKAEVAMFSGWASKGKPSNAHFGISKGLQVAIAEKCPEHILYKVGAVPVLNPQSVVEDILDTYIKAKELDVKKIATSRSSGAKVKLDAVTTALAGLPQEVLDAMKASGFDPSTI